MRFYQICFFYCTYRIAVFWIFFFFWSLVRQQRKFLPHFCWWCWLYFQRHIVKDQSSGALNREPVISHWPSYMLRVPSPPEPRSPALTWLSNYHLPQHTSWPEPPCWTEVCLNLRLQKATNRFLIFLILLPLFLLSLWSYFLPTPKSNKTTHTHTIAAFPFNLTSFCSTLSHT